MALLTMLKSNYWLTSCHQFYLQTPTIITLKSWINKYTRYRQNHLANKSSGGQVYLIGAGVGDIELLTIKAYRLLQNADVIMVDWLVNKDLYQYFNKRSEILFVGKKCGKHSIKQEQICELLLSKAQQGKTVVRLKGGDPSIFGRLAEETDILQRHGIPFAVVPGITAATGCAAYSGIPLTHRNCAQSVRFITASLKSTEDEVKWSTIANEQDTLVFYMGLGKVDQIAQSLMNHGMRYDMPIAIVDQGTLSEQITVCATLQTIAQEKLKHSLKGPAMIIVGEVVNKRCKVDLTLLLNHQKNQNKEAAIIG